MTENNMFRFPSFAFDLLEKYHLSLSRATSQHQEEEESVFGPNGKD